MGSNDKVKSQSPIQSGTKVKIASDAIKTDDGAKQSDGKRIEEELKRKIEEFEDKYKRALADYQNLEKRVAEERKEWIIKANKDLLLHLLPVLDTLMLAEKHIKVGYEGLSLGIKQFQDLLKNENIERIATLGKNFDPRLMECIEIIGGEEGKVLEEIRAGYMLYDKVLRVAQVKVGKGS